MIGKVIGKCAYCLTELICIVYRPCSFRAVTFNIVKKTLY